MKAAIERRRDSNGAFTGKSGAILKELEKRFVSGRYQFGELISINSLADEFEASRQPVSAAVSHLRSMGYVTIVPQVGCKVVSPSVQDVSDFFYLLGKAESGIAGLAATRWTSDDIDQLRKRESEISAVAFDTSENRDTYADAVDSYHFKIHDMAQSGSVIVWLEGLWRLADFYLWQGAKVNLSSKKVEQANKERRAIVRALKQRDVKLVESLVEAHVNGKPRRVGVV
jgi:DNA-binding GntR family transcriptional regulator